LLVFVLFSDNHLFFRVPCFVLGFCSFSFSDYSDRLLFSILFPRKRSFFNPQKGDNPCPSFPGTLFDVGLRAQRGRLAVVMDGSHSTQQQHRHSLGARNGTIPPASAKGFPNFNERIGEITSDR
jgi:hypothetical protein